jgi:hypothetical protein
MAIPPLLVWDNTGTPQAHRLLSGTTLESTQLGAATGFAAGVLDPSQGRLPHGRIVEFRGDLYLIHRGTVYKFSFGTTKEWISTGFTLSSPPTLDDQSISSLHVMDVNGEAAIVGVYNRASSSNGHAFWSTDGTNWNLSSLISNSGSWARFSLPYQGKLWVAGASNDWEVWNYDFDTQSASNFPFPDITTNRNGQLINFQGRLFWVGTNISGGARQPLIFKELVGGGFADVTYSGGANPGLMVTKDGPTAGSIGMFEDGGNLYVVWWNMIDNAFLGQMQVHQFIPNGTAVGSSFQENNISALVVPSAWLSGGAFESSGSLTTNVNVYVSTTTPGSPEVFWWRYNSVPIGTSTFWTWNGPSLPCTVVNSVGSQYAIPSGPNSTGEYVWTEGDFDVTLENAQAAPGKVSFDFQAHTPIDGSSPGGKLGRLFYSVGGSDWIQATLSTAPIDAPLTVSGIDPAPNISGNLLQGITVGDSKYRATWDAAADGFTDAGEQAELMLEVF